MSKLIGVCLLGLILAFLAFILRREDRLTPVVNTVGTPLAESPIPEPGHNHELRREHASEEVAGIRLSSHRSAAERLRDEAELQVLREEWALIHAQNILDRARELEEKGIGTTRLREALETSGVLLEQIPPDLEDFTHLSEVERAAIADLLITSGSRRVKHGKSPLDTLGDSDRTELQHKIEAEGICYPPEYMIAALGGDPERVDSTIFHGVREARIQGLHSLAVLLADQQCRINSTIKLGIAEGFGNELNPFAQTPLLDPSFGQLEIYSNDQHLRYREAVAALLRGQ